MDPPSVASNSTRVSTQEPHEENDGSEVFDAMQVLYERETSGRFDLRLSQYIIASGQLKRLIQFGKIDEEVQQAAFTALYEHHTKFKTCEQGMEGLGDHFFDELSNQVTFNLLLKSRIKRIEE